MYTIENLGRRLQVIQGLQWLYGAEGDEYATLLRGYEEDPLPVYEQVRERGSLWRSRLGPWVTAHHGVAAELLDHPGLGARRADGSSAVGSVLPLDEAFFGLERAHVDRLRAAMASALPSDVADRAAQACERVLGRTDDDFDLINDVVTRVTVDQLADLFGLPARARDRLADACLATSIALDGQLCPQQLVRTQRMFEAIEDLRQLFGPEATGAAVLGETLAPPDIQALGVLLAVAGARTAIVLAGNAVLALLEHPTEWNRLVEEPERAHRAVRETLRYAPPVQVHAVVAHTDLECEGQQIEAGSQVALLIAAANRDSGVFAAPDRFDPDRVTSQAELLEAGLLHEVVGPLARAHAEGIVRAMATCLPGLRRTGHPLWSRRAPVTRGLLRLPVGKS
ncbi:P450-derived glycosyltransferase activator [Nocardia salmonicida]|uniref:cytochrome P450 family protein n=1 Tax=Nocardia salmonicida TaxID=53431 RepID=UPI003408B138